MRRTDEPYLPAKDSPYYVFPEEMMPAGLSEAERRAPRVTSVTGILDKSPQLTTWAARLERAAIFSALRDMAEAGEVYVPKGSPASLLLARVEQLAGKGKEHVRELERAGDIGTRVHLMVENTIRTAAGEPVRQLPLVERAQREAADVAFMAWEDWWRSQDIRVVAVERRVWSVPRRVVGTVDLQAEAVIPGREELGRVPTIVDWKTTKSGIYLEHKLQGSAYCGLAHERGWWGDEWPWLLELRLPKRLDDPSLAPEPHWIPPEETREMFQIFTAMVPVSLWFYEQKALERKAWYDARR